jgi:hypothetical protein
MEQSARHICRHYLGFCDTRYPRRYPLSRQVLQPVALGGKGIRTPGLLIANETLYQLSYTPT